MTPGGRLVATWALVIVAGCQRLPVPPEDVSFRCATTSDCPDGQQCAFAIDAAAGSCVAANDPCVLRPNDSAPDQPARFVEDGTVCGDGTAVCIDRDCVAARCGDGFVTIALDEECDDGDANSDTFPGACRTGCREARCGDGVIDPGERCDDGDGNRDDGTAACRTTCVLSRCGDGFLDVGEECDDGDDNSDVRAGACRKTCRSAACGDGVKDRGEGCDDGALNDDSAPGACRSDCAPSHCGDGIQDDGEQCDEGPVERNEPDRCRTTCVLPSCGDGVRDSGEACDAGADNSDVRASACRTDCTPPTCGDDVIDDGEQCDDGAQNSDTRPDACRTTCARSGCGDGVKDEGEECDDGADNSDERAGACRTTCRPAGCGDRVIDDGEECDDGGRNSDLVGGACRSSCTQARCGDGVIDPGEGCDDGSGNSDAEPDACRPTCKRASCGDGVTDDGEECDDGPANGAPDACRRTCVLPVCGDGIEDPGEECDDGRDNSDVQGGACRTSCQLARCGDGIKDPGESCDDGVDNSADAPNACRTTCARSTCGDGVKDTGEECDEGPANGTAADACRPTCARASCGDGVKDTGEACDDGAQNSDVRGGACRTSCRPAACGDGVKDPGEGCDADGDNSDVVTGACRSDCAPAGCGDGVVDVGEACDDGPRNSDVRTGACRTTCVPAACGDGVIDGGEECDDGAQNSDVRAAACRRTCARAGCGDGVIDPGEGCDDGLANSDAASAACRTTCVPAACGDGVIDDDEVCDDGNVASGDGCRGDCTKVELCGDAVVDVGEACDDGNANPRDGCSGCRRQVWRADVVVDGSLEKRLATNVALPSPAGVAVDPLGRVFVADAIRNQVLRVDPDGSLTVVAGSGAAGFSGDGGPASAAQLNAPSGVAVDNLGRVLIADTSNHRIRRIDRAGTITTIVGRQQTFGSIGDGLPATEAQLKNPTAIVVDAAGRLFIADSRNHRVRRVDENGVIATIAGNGTPGAAGDGGPASLAELNGPRGVAVDRLGRVVIADSGSRRVRRIDDDGTIRTIAGTGILGFSGDGQAAVDAQLSFPSSVVVGKSGAIFITDVIANVVRRIDEDTIMTVVGAVDSTGRAVNTALRGPVGVAVDAEGRLFVTEQDGRQVLRVGGGPVTVIAGTTEAATSGALPTSVDLAQAVLQHIAIDGSGRVLFVEMNAARVRRLEPDGTISVVAGSGTSGFSGDGGPATQAELSSPFGIALDDRGRVYISDSDNHRIRRIDERGTIETIVGGGTGYSCREPGTGCRPTPAGPFCVDAALSPAPSALDCTADASGCDQGFACVDFDDGSFCLEECLLSASGTPQGFSGDGGPAVDAQLTSPRGLVVDARGRLFIADSANNRVRRVDEDGVITTVAGTGIAGSSGDGGPATGAQLSAPIDVAIDGRGQLFILDAGNQRIRRVDGNGLISTAAGTGLAGFAGDDGPAGAARLNAPSAVAIAGDGAVLVADRSNQRVRRIAVDPSGVPTTITTLAGTGTQGLAGDGGPASTAQLDKPAGVEVDATGAVLVVDSGNNRIRRVDVNGTITAVFGSIHPEGPGFLPTARLYPSKALLALDDQRVISVGGFGRGLLVDLARARLEVVVGYEQAASSVQGEARFAPALGAIGGIVFDPGLRALLLAETNSASLRVIGVDGDGDGVVDDPTTWTHAVLPLGAVSPAGLALSADGSYAVADPVRHCVQRIARDGSLLSTAYGSCGSPGSLPGFLNGPTHVVVSPATGALYIADTGNHRVLRIEGEDAAVVVGDGSISSAGEGGPARLFPVQSPRQLALDAFGNLYVTSTTTVRLVENVDGDLDADGDDRVKTIFGGGAGDVFPASDAQCIDALAITDSAVFAADACRGFLVRIDPAEAGR